MYSTLFKIWHWLNGIILLGLVATVFLKDAFFSKSINADILAQKLQTMSIVITHEQAITLAKTLSKPFWEWHLILGYTIAALLVLRVLLIFDKKTQKEKPQNNHKKIVKIGYKIFLGIIALFLITGFMMAFKADFGLSKELVAQAKEIHKTLFFALWFIPLHIIGVIMEHKKEQNHLIDKII